MTSVTENPQTQPPKLLRPGKALLVTLIAAAAALVSADCTYATYLAVDRAVYGDGVAETAIASLISAGIALVIGCLFIRLARNLQKLKMFTAISIAAYISIFLTGRLLFRPSSALPLGMDDWGWASFLTCAMPIIILMVIVGRVTQEEAGDWNGIRASAICGTGAVIGAIAIIFGFLFTYEICIGFFGVDCPDERPLNKIPFAMITGSAPLIIAADPALSANKWFLPP